MVLVPVVENHERSHVDSAAPLDNPGKIVEQRPQTTFVYHCEYGSSSLYQLQPASLLGILIALSAYLPPKQRSRFSVSVAAKLRKVVASHGDAESRLDHEEHGWHMPAKHDGRNHLTRHDDWRSMMTSDGDTHTHTCTYTHFMCIFIDTYMHKNMHTYVDD